jgi:hypothetical protein
MAKDSEVRQFGVGSPVVRISRSSTHAVERIIVWDDFNNEPNVSDYNWPLHSQAPATEVDTGKIYTHHDGVRFHAAMTFTYWHPDYQAAWPDGLVHQFFNEHDFTWLLKAQCGTTYDIEFFPSTTIAQGTPPNAKYQCHILSLSRTRAEDNAYVWNCILEVEGINIVAAADIPVA